MKLYNHDTKQLEEVPEAAAPQLLASQKYGLPNAPVAMANADGEVKMFSPQETQAVIDSGGRFATEQEHHQAHLENKYGSLGGHLAAAGEGLARGATLGVSDPLAIGAARLFGGEKTAEEVRTHLQEEKEAHPWIAGGSELIGAAAPILLSGGAAAPEEAAIMGATKGAGSALGALDEAGAIAKIGQGVRTLGAIPRGVGALGDYAEHAVSGLLGAPESAIGKAAVAAAKTATRGIVEGSLFGAGGQISENALENKDLTAEKLFTGIGHAALTSGLTAGLAGVGLGFGGKLLGEAGSAVLGKFSPKLSEAAGEQTWKWLDPLKKYSEEANARAGGTDAVGRTVFEKVLRPLVEEKGISAAAMSAEEKLTLVRAAADKTGGEIGDLIKGNAHATVSLADMLKPIDEQLSRMRGEVLGGGKVNALEELKADLTRILGAEGEAMPAAARVARTNEEIGTYLRENPSAAEELAKTNKLPERALFKDIPQEVSPKAAQDVQVSIGDAITQRRALQQRVFQETKALDPNLRVGLLREVSGAWNDLEYSALNKASEATGGLEGNRLKALNKEFQQLSIAEKALETNTSRIASNNTFSLSDKMFGAAHLAGALAHGNPFAIAGAAATTAASKAARAHGNAYAALMLDRLATWGGVSRATAEVNEQVDRAIESAMAKKPAAKPRLFQVGGKDDDARFERERSRVEQLAAIAPAVMQGHMDRQTAPLATHAPALAQGVAAAMNRTTQFLAKQLAPQPMPGGMTPQLQKPQYSSQDKTNFLRCVDAVEGGPEGVLKRLAAGIMTPQDMAYMTECAPLQLAETRQKMKRKGAQLTFKPTLQKRMQISRYMGEPLDETQGPVFGNALTSAYAAGRQHTAQATQQRAAAKAGNKNTIAKQMMGPFEAAQRGQ